MTEDLGMSVTLKDVAKLAQTDITSVSVTLRNTPQAAELKESTRKRIIEAAKYLGYTGMPSPPP